MTKSWKTTSRFQIIVSNWSAISIKPDAFLVIPNDRDILPLLFIKLVLEFNNLVYTDLKIIWV